MCWETFPLMSSRSSAHCCLIYSMCVWQDVIALVDPKEQESGGASFSPSRVSVSSTAEKVSNDDKRCFLPAFQEVGSL